MTQKQRTKYALERLLFCFYNLDSWPTISVAVDKTKDGKTLWFHGGKVDDTTREAIRYAERILNDPKTS